MLSKFKYTCILRGQDAIHEADKLLHNIETTLFTKLSKTTKFLLNYKHYTK